MNPHFVSELICPLQSQLETVHFSPLKFVARVINMFESVKMAI